MERFLSVRAEPGARLEVVLADALGFCFGVRDALALVRQRAHPDGPLSVLGPIVHNPRVVAELAREGVRIVSSLEDVPPGGELVLTPHGVADAVRAAAERHAGPAHLSDATCPLVRRVHDVARRLVSEGRHLVVVGRADHVEVRGLVGSFAEGEWTAVLDDEDLPALEGRPRLGVVAQTTQPLPRVEALVAAIRARFPSADVAFVDTVCHPTKTRQEAVRRLARDVQGVVVVGGRTSNNTRELAYAAREEGALAWWVESAADLDPSWFRGLRRIGVTAGTSTPDDSVAEVVAALERLEVAAA